MNVPLTNGPLLIVIAALILAVVIMFTIAANQRRRSDLLRERFGPEYNRTVDELGDRRRAEAELAARTQRVRAFDLHPLSEAERNRFSEAWRATQARFVDDPSGAVKEADRLVGEAMRARGYPVGDFEQRAADVSVDHAQVVQNYRAAHDIALRNDRGKATTEDLRQAMVYYRELFNELLATEPEHAEATR